MSESKAVESVKWNVSLAQLTLAIVWILIGAAAAEVVRNIAGAEKVSFSTTELIGFILSVVLSAASIVLAIAAIWLGKISELSMVRRSDESIRMQNEVYIRTTEALNRIESSTGVTEKRIEDIIAGRAGDISHKIAELTSGKGGLSRDPEVLEREIKRIIEGTQTARSEEEETKRRAAIVARRDRYRRFHQSVLTAFANKPGLVAKKLGDGESGGEGQALFDVVATLSGTTIGVSAFSGQVNAETPSFAKYLISVARALQSGEVGHVYIAFDIPSESAEAVKLGISEALSVYKGDLQSKVTPLLAQEGEVEKLIEAIPTS